MPTPTFSVITPSYNQALYIRENIEAVIAQDYPHVEHIVIDNASTDGTVEILKAYPGLKWISEPDSGQSDAVNKALEYSSNEWIVWVNSDDFLLPGALATLAGAIERNPAAAAIISNNVRVNEHGERIATVKPNYSSWKLRHWWWSSLQLWQPGSVFRKEVFDYAGPLDIELHFSMDFDFMLKAQDRYPFERLDADLVAFRLHEQQKGNASEIPFIDERIRSTRSYWKARNMPAYWFYSTVLYFVAGSLKFVHGLRAYESGDANQGRKLIRAGLMRNPAAVFRPEHLGFWLRKLIGRDAYYRIR